MAGQFPRIGLFCKSAGENISETLNHLVEYLGNRRHQLLIEQSSAALLANPSIKAYPSDQIGQHCDLIIVVGGDGSLLKAARCIADHNIPIIGINRGALGFLADINPHALEQTLTPILDGNYHAEERTMLKASIIQNHKPVSQHLALNDVVLHHGDIARLIEFEIYIDDQFVVDHRSDGLITSTPTGSTAYALSGGGPIVYPTLDVLTLVPMFPHTLSARPIVIHKSSKIRLVITASNRIDAKLSCDGQTHLSLTANDEVHIQAHGKSLRLLHPKDYNYYSVLRERLGWNINLTK
jgi:NAD+ kinase